MAKKMLVAYYSWSNGNTEKVAEQLADACGADLERIETVEPYPEDYDQTVQQARTRSTPASSLRSARSSTTRRTTTSLPWALPPGGTPWRRL